MSDTIASILAGKGSEVVTITAGGRLADAVRLLSEHRIGALVVVGEGDVVIGILSERDVVRRLGTDGGAVLDATVGEVMTAPVSTCGPDATTDELSRLMTERRFRHVPVVVDGRLAGIVSIGDVVKRRLDELHTRTQQLSDYVAGSY